MIVRMAVVLLATWLFVAGFALAPPPGQAANMIACGALATALAVLSMRYRKLILGVAAIGLWLVLSTWVFPASDRVFWNNILCGLLLGVLALVSRPYQPAPGLDAGERYRPFTRRRTV